ncbi:MAG: hypothetical protein IKI69_05910 [Oscillospiraceae bacterium]|nr:hypothetical protein [Oscillospiraceae bacterium]
MKRNCQAGFFRLLCLALCAALCLSLAACGADKAAPEEEPKQETLAEATPAPTPAPTPVPTPTPTVESLAIHYMGEPIKDNDCTAKVGETLPLSIVCVPGGVSGVVEWSVDKTCEASFELTVSESDPYRCELRCISILPDGAGGAKITATLYGVSASILVHVLPGEGGITTLKKADADQTVEICRGRGENPVYEFTITPGYETRLCAKALKGGNVENVVWSMDEEAAKVLCFTPSQAHPGQMLLECFGPLPAGHSFVEIYAELDGVKTTCRVYIAE